ncbi:MAG TPA: hypothetical protein EYH42_02950 [Sulfurovum sp.]|nr:hypothetical protein [Sulfurovum sp.]
MGFGKMLGLAALGIGAVAAAPFTGGGSILGAATLGASLAGAGTIAAAAGAGAVGAAAGVALTRKEEEEEKRRNEKSAKNNKNADKATDIVKGYEKHTTLIIALTAIGVAMANADGEISEEEREELNEYVGGVASANYPEVVLNTIKGIIANPPTFNEAMKYLEKVSAVEYPEIRNLLVAVMESDNKIHDKEKAFLSAYDSHITMLAS